MRRIRSPASGPNPNFLRIVEYQTTGNSWYNAMLLGLERRAGRGPAFGLSYTLSKQERDVEDFGFMPQNNYDRGAEKGPASNDRRHQIVTNVVYALPWQDSRSASSLRRARRSPSTSRPAWTTTGTPASRPTGPTSPNPNGDPRTPVDLQRELHRTRRQPAAQFRARPGLLRDTPARLEDADLRRRENRSPRAVRRGAQRHQPRQPEHAAGQPRSAAFGQSTAFNNDSSPRQVEIGFRLDF